MPEPACAPGEVLCCVCSQLWDSRDPGVLYRSLDGRWWCADGRACLDWAARAAALRTLLQAATASSEDLAAMFRALDDAWARLWARMGWDT